MSEKKHTTGPWSWERSPLDNNRIALLNDIGQNVMTTISEDSQGHTFIDINDEDACLIDAAPDLLAALQPFADQHVSDDAACHFHLTTKEKCGRCSRILAARAARDKAKGVIR